MDTPLKLTALFFLLSGGALVVAMLIVVWKINNENWTSIVTAIGVLSMLIGIILIAFGKTPTKPNPENEAYELALILRNKKQEKIDRRADRQRQINYQKAMRYYKSRGITIEPVDNRQEDYFIANLEAEQNRTLSGS